MFWLILALLVVLTIGCFITELFADDDEFHPEDGQDHFTGSAC